MITAMTVTNNSIEEAVKAGTIYGHKKSRTHPRMKPFIVGNRNEIEIIDTEATLNSFQKSVSYLEDVVRNGGLMLLVSLKPAAKESIDNFSREFNFPYVTNRWLGGTLTNFQIIRKRLEYYQNLRSQKERGGLEKYTKKERSRIEKELQKLSENFDGLLNLTRLPDCVFMVDPSEHKTAVREAGRLKIPVVAIMDTDDDPEEIDYPIIANDHAKVSIDWLVGKIIENLKQIKPISKEE